MSARFVAQIHSFGRQHRLGDPVLAFQMRQEPGQLAGNVLAVQSRTVVRAVAVLRREHAAFGGAS